MPLKKIKQPLQPLFKDKTNTKDTKYRYCQFQFAIESNIKQMEKLKGFVDANFSLIRKA